MVLLERQVFFISYATGAFPGGYTPTIVDDYTLKVMVDGKPINLRLWDTGGQHDYDRLRPLSYRQTDLFLVAFDVSNRDSFRNVKSKWIPELQHYAPDVPFILVGTKSDLRSDTSTTSPSDQNMVGEQEIQHMVQDIGAVKYCETSALTGEGLKDVFEEAIKTIALSYSTS